jgi:hypothetical protein
VTCLTTERRAIVSGSQIDRLCHDWLRENYGEEIASEYTTYSLVIPMWNSADLNDALEDLKFELYLYFGPEQSFGATNYYEAREKLGLPDDRTPVPDVFLRAFATK